MAIFSVIFFDIVSWGMIIPLIPILGRDFGAEGFTIGLLISCYSTAQFLFAPFWGRLSDTFGRKPIILIGLFGSALSYAIFAFSTEVSDMFLAQAIAGLLTSRPAVATAYIADVTSAQNRSKNIGLIGMAFGAGFAIGPVFGFLFILLGEKLGGQPPYSAHFSAMGASFFCFINFLMSCFFLRESLKSKKSFFEVFKRKNPLFVRPSVPIIIQSLRSPKTGLILTMSFMLWLSLAQIEPALILFVQDDFFWSQKSAYGSFIYVGFLMAISQGYFVRKCIPKWGESRTHSVGLLSMSAGLLSIALSGFLPGTVQLFSLAFLALFVGVTLFSVGYSLSNTSLSGALSLTSSSQKQGSIFGVGKSLSSATRIIGPAMGGWLYQNFSHESPFLSGGVLTLIALFLAFRFPKSIPNAGKKTSSKKKSKQIDEDLFSLNYSQLKSLIDKNIPFGFFYLGQNPLLKREKLMKRAEQITISELFSRLKGQDIKKALVLLCDRGELSQEISQKLRDQGFINVYFVEGGFEKLKAEADPLLEKS